MRWALPFLIVGLGIALLSAGAPPGRFVRFVRAEDGVAVWINPASVMQVRESISADHLTMIVFSTGVWMDVKEPPDRVVHRLSE